MGFRSVNSGVERLVAWADSKVNNPLLRYEPCRIYLERSSKNCLLFGKSPCVRARIEDYKSGKVYLKTSFSLYPLIPPILGLCADARTLDVLEKVAAALHDKGVRYESSLDIKD
jgi:hypothetical protein